ncbi:MAG: pyrroline-5-carboxylate reductase [Muribaculaceae bacterium]|nr:pyrroline-5-carboxylate reductase [Muribaculaceae bacterium]
MSIFKKITVIGAGNMGSAIAAGLVKYSDSEICLANRSEGRLTNFMNAYGNYSNFKVTTDLADSVKGSSLVVLAVKPWAVKDVTDQIRENLQEDSVVVSVAAGISIADLKMMIDRSSVGVIYMIPNTALQVGKGMTFATASGVEDAKIDAIHRLFAPLTRLKFIDEAKMGAATALCSCGIAYVYKFIAAAAQAGVELGFSYDEAVDYFTATVSGATAVIESSDLTLQQLVNAVTTPGGMTIRGVNELERKGFTAAVIDSIISPLKK